MLLDQYNPALAYVHHRFPNKHLVVSIGWSPKKSTPHHRKIKKYPSIEHTPPKVVAIETDGLGREFFMDNGTPYYLDNWKGWKKRHPKLEQEEIDYLNDVMSKKL